MKILVNEIVRREKIVSEKFQPKSIQQKKTNKMEISFEIYQNQWIVLVKGNYIVTWREAIVRAQKN